jgi:hypothetical protein
MILRITVGLVISVMPWVLHQVCIRRIESV